MRTFRTLFCIVVVVVLVLSIYIRPIHAYSINIEVNTKQRGQLFLK